MRANWRKLAVPMICLAAILLVGCPPKEIRIGAVLPLSGDAQSYGTAIQKGLELALAELQAEGANIVLDVVDSEGNPEKARDLLEQQFDNNALVVVGGATSSEAKAMIPVIDKWERILISPSATSPELTGISKYFYRIAPSDFTAANKMADFASRSLQIKNVVVIAELQPYAKGIQSVFQPAFEAVGGEVLDVIEIPPGTGDLSGIISHVLTLEPDAVYLAAYEVGISSMIQALRETNYAGKILTTQAFATPTAIARVGQDAEGVILTHSVFELDSDHSHVKTFVNGFQEKNDERPDIFAAQGYDTLKVVYAAIGERQLLPSEVVKGLRELKDHPGVTGSIQFDNKGDVKKYPRVYIIGEDLGLYDFNERVQKQQEELRKRREELRRQLEKIQRQASEMNNG